MNSRSTMPNAVLVAAALLVSCATAGASELDLRRVMLSAGGVGYFEYEAEVEGDATLELSVRLDQVDDVMKSIVVYDDRDPERAAENVELTEDEGHTLAEMLGGSRVHERLQDAQHQLDDLVISWVTIDPSSEIAGLTIADAHLRRRTGVGVVGLVGESGSIPVPDGSHSLEPGATAVVVGPPAAVEAATALLGRPSP